MVVLRVRHAGRIFLGSADWQHGSGPCWAWWQTLFCL